jgi:endoglucanase
MLAIAGHSPTPLNSNTSFHFNQIGYLPMSPKEAIITGATQDEFMVISSTGKVVKTGILGPEEYWDKSEQMVRIASFSDITAPGIYTLKCGNSESGKFQIARNVFTDLVKASAKYYYFNRASTELQEIHAGEYSRPFAHADTSSIIHASAASEDRPAGTTIRTPRGWYDAGDYNKYIVNSGITTFTLMHAYEQNQALFDTLTWNIPESSNGIPDILDEVRWNLEWMMTMQDPDDGGVYHKNTTARFEGFVPPVEAVSTRYVVQKSTAATLDFAAVLARASRIYSNHDALFVSKMKKMAENAWEWAMANPEVLFKNPGNSGNFGPAIVTGEYGDRSVQDEFLWAASELFLTTGKEQYLKSMDLESFQSFKVPSWSNVEALALITISGSAELESKLKQTSDTELLKLADELLLQAEKSPYHVPLNEFRWGSNSDILNQGMILMNAAIISGNEKYWSVAVSCLDYILGRNAVGICFVTGFGYNSPKYPHHRPSASDNVAAPIPGMLIGGPNPRNMDQDCGKEMYPMHQPAMAYIDEECSYSTNEVAINWNAPLVYLSASLQSKIR